MSRCIIFSLVFVLLLGGCSFKDIDKRLFVLAFGIDKNDDDKEPFHLSLKVAKLGSGNNGQPQNSQLILEAKGESLSNAVQKIRAEVDKELDFGHAKLVVFGSDILPGQAEYLSDWFFRKNEIQQIMWVSIADKKAVDVLKVKSKTVSQPSDVLIMAFERKGSENPYTISKYLFAYRRQYLDDGVDPVLPVINVKDSEHIVETSAVLNQDGELLRLQKEETKLLNLLNKQLNKFDITVKLDDNLLTMVAQTADSSLTLVPKKGPPAVQVSINLNGSIEESFERVTENEFEKAEKAIEKKINQQVEAMLKLFQEKNVDPLGLGIRYRSMQWNDPDSFERWKELYPTVTFEVDTAVRIRGTGTVE